MLRKSDPQAAAVNRRMASSRRLYGVEMLRLGCVDVLSRDSESGYVLYARFLYLTRLIPNIPQSSESQRVVPRIA
jgi:hypothetical protein